MKNSTTPTTSNAPLKKASMKSSIYALAMLSASTFAAHAAPNDGIVGPYARVEVGVSNFSLSGSRPQTSTDGHGKAVKVFGGYRFNENLGIEAGYASLGSLSTSSTVGGINTQIDGKASSVFAAATGRVPMGESFALQGRLGVSFGQVSGTSSLPGSDYLIGRKTSVLIGVGAEYRPTSIVVLSINYDSYGKLSNDVSASSLVFGAHFWF